MPIQNDERYGKGVVAMSEELVQLKDADQEFAQRIGLIVKKSLDSDDFQPPLLPEVALSLSELANEPNVSFGKVEDVVKRDPVIAAKVVAVANSAFYSRGTPVRSLRVAITRLGLSEVRDVAFHVVAQTRVFRVKGYTDRMRVLFEAAQASGIIARKICQILRFESELAYLCGLLHDMGEAIILGIVGEAYRKEKGKVPPIERLAQPIAAYHAAAGARVCSLWGLPEMIVDAVTCHHRPEESTNSSQMATVVAVADILLKHAGIGVQQKIVDPLREPLFYKLNLTPDQVAELLEFAEFVAENPDGSAISP
ncbi:MAG: HDOD domain-containing protein [Deltaproteobacteria bacterium]|nr:HDOD domain-containing protein [Deltaproteobacteria bacterium]